MGVKLQDIIIRKTISLQDLTGTIILLHFKKLISKNPPFLVLNRNSLIVLINHLIKNQLE